ncbi:MAG: sialate O-acetylesterase, partial [Muribaculaceae bacterium]|nr:sialate O-acetylesterase [Muribaculaceae bacterium]
MRLLIKSLFIAGASALAAAPVASAESEYWEQRASLFDILPVNSGDIVFLGNSITDGGEFAELFGMSNIKNRGISADVVKGVEKRLDRVIENQPKKIFLLIGINDVSHNLSADSIASDYARIVKRIRKEAPRTELYIQSVMPVNNDFKRYKNLLGKERVITELNGKLRTL